MPFKFSAKILLGLLLLAGFAIRLQGIHWGLPSKTMTLASYNPDEAFVFQTLEYMYKNRSARPPEIALHYGTFHFYMAGAILMAAKVAGYVQLGGRDFLLANLEYADRMYLVMRMFSVLCGVLSVWGVYKIAKRIYDENIALWAAFFMAFSPIAVSISHVSKLDALLPLLVLWLSWKTLDLMENPSSGNAWFCGLLSGVLASTRYNCGIFIAAPLGMIILNRQAISFSRIYPVLAGSLLAFLVTTPYAVLDFKTFMDGIYHMGRFVTTPSVGTVTANLEETRVYNIIYFFKTMTPFGMGWTATVLFVVGGILCLKNGIASKQGSLLIGLFVYVFMLLFSIARHTHYLAPIVPAIAVLAAFGLVRINGKLPRFAGVVLSGMLVFSQIGYAWAFNGLYAKPNPRELAGEWIKNNLQEGQSVGMIRSFFWTPGILRQKNPPYAVKCGGDEQSEFWDAIEGLEKMVPPDYFVLSWHEAESVRFFSLRKQKDYNAILNNFLEAYTPVAVFELEPSLPFIRVWRNPAPWDLKIISPRLEIYKRKQS